MHPLLFYASDKPTTTPPTTTILVKNVRITEGDDLTLNCTKGINIQEWSRKEGEPDISDESRILKDGKSKVISSSATVKDSGKYLCEIDRERYVFNVSVEVLVKVEMVISVLSYTFTPELQNKSSQVYKETERNFTAEMDKVYNNTPGYVRTEVLNFTRGSVKVDFRVIIVFVATDPKNESTIIDKKATTGQTIIKEAKNGLVSRLRVKPQVIVKTPPPEPQGVEFFGVKSNEIGIQWMVPEGFKSFDILSYEVEHWTFGKMDKLRKKLLAPEAKTEYSHRIQDLEPKTTYMIRVAAINVHGSNYNEAKARKTPPAPDLPPWAIALIVLVAIAAIIGVGICIRRRAIQRRAQHHEDEVLAVMESPKKVESVLNQEEKVKGLNLKFTNASYRPTDVDWTEIPFENIKIMDELGSGAFGVVYKGEICGKNGEITPCAVKALKASATDEEMRDLYNELEIMSNIGSHPNLVNLLGACTKDGNLLVVLEIAENGSLIEFLKKIRSKNENYEGEGAAVSGGLSTDMKLSIALDVAKGMAHLASHRCIHRDLAARNVLLGENYVAKVADYGMARDVYEQLMYKKETQGKLPVKWMAIESLETYVFTVESDVWSYGVLLWEMETGGLKPYPGLTTTELMSELRKGYRLEKPNGCSDEMYQVMMDCWHSNPSLRPTFDQLVERLEKMSVSS
ncbi:PREDICTED: angiopoietin-1 receptor-like isoform X4 [Acropora digitifera]|uniref:angiopoietin-1 receptor-like isoform X4 n=1 Tax=Acropora digitifera TaxID=70779 RepID=UPI00077B0564|nr:PREDICTED: angiopoietin-1 receptor-like isoform X4 [Acropora digitifera]